MKALLCETFGPPEKLILKDKILEIQNKLEPDSIA